MFFRSSARRSLTDFARSSSNAKNKRFWRSTRSAAVTAPRRPTEVSQKRARTARVPKTSATRRLIASRPIAIRARRKTNKRPSLLRLRHPFARKTRPLHAKTSRRRRRVLQSKTSNTNPDLAKTQMKTTRRFVVDFRKEIATFVARNTTRPTATTPAMRLKFNRNR